MADVDTRIVESGNHAFAVERFGQTATSGVHNVDTGYGMRLVEIEFRLCAKRDIFHIVAFRHLFDLVKRHIDEHVLVADFAVYVVVCEVVGCRARCERYQYLDNLRTAALFRGDVSLTFLRCLAQQQLSLRTDFALSKCKSSAQEQC